MKQQTVTRSSSLYKIGKTKGLTLIELLLVIAIIAIILLTSIDVMRARQMRKNLNATAAQMQNLLRFGVEAHAGTGKWPNSASKIKQMAGTDMALCSSWPNPGGSGSCGPYLSFDVSGDDDAYYYTVSITMPTEQAADALVGLVPGGTISNKRTVSAYVMGQKQKTLKPKEGYITGGGAINARGKSGGSKDNSTVFLPYCPEGYEGHYIPMPWFFQTDFKTHLWNDEHWCMKIKMDKSNLRDVALRDMGNSISGTYAKLKFTTGEGSCEYETRYSYYYTFCLPEGKWQRKNTSASAQMSQCDESWTNQYNSGDDVEKC